MPESERAARRALACVIEAGDPRVAKLVRRVGAHEVWNTIQASARRSSGDPGSAGAWSRRAAALDPADVQGAEARAGLRFVVPGDDEWPEQLDALDGCSEVQGLTGQPLGLWLRGRAELAAATARAVAVVGSRACTQYGVRVATGLASDLVMSGFTVVSGGAYGIDTAAHRGALADGGTTVAFLAGGLDELYPKENAPLLEQVARSGVLVSEYPPGASPTRARFLARNRLIAASTQGTVVVEGAARSGAHNTATWALECRRHLMAVPGPVGNATSSTPHRLIREGKATLISCLNEIRELLEPLGSIAESRLPADRLLDGLTDAQKAAYESLPSRGGRDVDDIARRSGLTTGDCLTALGTLALSGLVLRRGDGRWGLGSVGDRPLLSHELPGPGRRATPLQ